jgi:radical SAM family uncharacterized protein
VLISEGRLRLLLARVQKPARYAGREWNSICKDWDTATVRLALVYPETYEIGMSNLGLAILYDLVNRRAKWLAERVYAPWDDMETEMRAAGMPLYSLETRHTLDDFDVLGFSLQHELNYSNVLNLLDLAGLPILSRDRQSSRSCDASMPLVIAGGSCTYNPEPMADFFDALVIGEGEEVLVELLQAYEAWKVARGQARPDGRRELLQRLAHIAGVYVPSLYTVDDATGDKPQARRTEEVERASGLPKPTLEGLPDRVLKRIVAELGPVPTSPIVCTMEVVHDRAMVEIQRGCSRGCRFCQAGIIYRPIRQRPVGEVLAAIDELVANTGHSELALVSLSSSDHPGVQEIVARAMARHAEEGLAISLPSLRIDSFSVELAEMIQSTRKTGFTFAPEAGSQRLRDVINKGVNEEDLLRTTAAAFSKGWNRLKLYFMLGLPTETDEDILEMARLIRLIHAQGRQIRGRMVDLSVSVSTFVPKPHTPFQWVPLASREVVEYRQRLLQQSVRARGISLSWSDWDTTWLEALLSRGDRRLGPIIARAWRLGARFEAWSDHFRPGLWREALAAEGIDADPYVALDRDPEMPCPWEIIDVGVTRSFLWREYQRALRGELSPDCREQCHGCGVAIAFATERAGVRADAWGCPS